MDVLGCVEVGCVRCGSLGLEESIVVTAYSVYSTVTVQYSTVQYSLGLEESIVVSFVTAHNLQ